MQNCSENIRIHVHNFRIRMGNQLTQCREESSVFFPFVMFGSRTAMIERYARKFLSLDPRSAGAPPDELGYREDEEARDSRRHRLPR